MHQATTTTTLPALCGPIYHLVAGFDGPRNCDRAIAVYQIHTRAAEIEKTRKRMERRLSQGYTRKARNLREWITWAEGELAKDLECAESIECTHPEGHRIEMGFDEALPACG